MKEEIEQEGQEPVGQGLWLKGLNPPCGKRLDLDRRQYVHEGKL